MFVRRSTHYAEELSVAPSADTSGIADAAYVGTAGRDRFGGTDGVDSFDLSQGGDDVARGGKGSDTFYFGAAFTAADRVNGGGGRHGNNNDVVTLDGDYSSGLEITAASFQNIEGLVLRGGSYTITGVLDFRENLGFTNVNASFLNENETLNLKVRATGDLFAFCGAGDDIIDGSLNKHSTLGSGGKGDDLFIAGIGRYSSFRGEDGDDIVIGSLSGDGTYFGDGGADTMTSRGSSDIFMFSEISDSTVLSHDIIIGFERGEDILRLLFDSDTTTVGMQHDFRLGVTPGRAGDIVIRYDAGLDHTIVDIFTDHDDQPDFEVHVTGNIPLTLADFSIPPN